MTDIWQKFHDDYPVNREMIWFNNCGTTPAAKSITAEVCKYLEAYAQRGIFADGYSFMAVKNGIRDILAKLLNCSSDELVLIHNTSEGMNFVSHGARLVKGDHIVLLENEYPSNIYPWRHWEEKGVNISYAAMGNTPDEFMQNLAGAITPSTKLVSLSVVHWCTGMPLPLEEISDLCLERNIDFVLDGAQGVGHVPVDLGRLNVTAMAFPAWKWLLGPLGLGVLYINREKLDGIDVVFRGQMSVKDSENYLPYKTELAAGADRFAVSTPAFTEWVYFLSSLRMLEEAGFDRAMNRLYELSGYLMDRLREEGYNVFADNFPGVKTGIVVFDRDGSDSGLLYKKLQENGVVAALRLGRVRLAPHIYNSTEQIDRVLEILKTV